MKLATLCYIKKDWKTLMLHRTKKENDTHKWKRNWLWWKLESWESPEECVIREIKEESGLNIRNPKLKWFLTAPNFDWKDDWYIFLFIATDFDWELIDSPEWDLKRIEDKKILNLNLREWDKIFLKYLDQNWFFSWKFEYKNKKLINYKFTIHK